MNQVTQAAAPQLPAYLQNRQSRSVAQTLQKNLGTASPPFISIRAQRFNFVDAAGNETPVPGYDPSVGPFLDGCIIDVNDHVSRVFYDVEYDPNAQSYQPPACWSDNGLAPSVHASTPQSPTCVSCAKSVWGSATSRVSGKGIPACSQTQKLALLIPGSPNGLYLLRCPPNSLKNLRSYTELFASGNGGDLTDVVTRIYFDPSIQGTLLFMAVSYIDQATATIREQLIGEKKTDALVGRTDTPIAGLLAAPAQQLPPQEQPMQQPLHSVPGSIPQQGVQPPQYSSHPQAQAGQPYPNPGVGGHPQGMAGGLNVQQPAQQQAPILHGQPQYPASNAAPQQPQGQPAPARRRRRTAAEIAADNAAGQGQQPQGQPAPQQQPQMAPFQPGAMQGAPQGQPQQQAPQGGAQTFGIGQGAPPNADMQAMLGTVFGQPQR